MSSALRPLPSAFCLLLFLGLTSCEIINPDEPVPVYSGCDSIPLIITASNQGTGSSSIVDAWAYVDGELIGAFELPARFPVIREGTHRMTVKPGIFVNGIKSTRAPYPFYASFDTTFDFVPGQTSLVMPKTTYLTSTVFALIEDFEQSGSYFERGPGSDTSLAVINDARAFETHSGAIYLDATHPYFNYRTAPPFVASPGTSVFAELNYQCDNEFTVGVISQLGATEVYEDLLTIRPSATWKKIYVNLSGAIGNEPLASGYRLVITAQHSNGALTSSIYLDNVKVVR